MSSDPEQITFFAQTDARGQNVPFGIKAKDRTRHVYVIGKTGMGKSTLLENMAIQDIKNGNGLAFIDPHGQTAETLLDYIPEERKDDVLYFAPFDTDNPVSFNVMEDVGPDKRHLVVSGLMSVFKKIWVDAWSARMEYILQNTLMALLEYPGSTLLGVNRMLSDKKYRKKVVENIKDPSVRSFWVDEFANYNERYMQEAGDAIKNKIGQFTANPLIRNIVGQPKSSFDVRDIMDNKKILIMNLSKGLVGESNANLLGSMLTTRIYLAAMSRADMGQAQMQAAPNFYFYVDEFQSFANATFANILSEARKYKLNLTIAHQYIEQMEEEVRNAVFGNVGTIISFRVGPFDAEVLETIFTPKFLAPDIVNLGFAQIYLTLMIDGIGSQPFSATTLPPIKPASISAKEMIIHRSRQQFAHKRDEVEKAINEWHLAIEEPPREPRPELRSSEKTALPPRKDLPPRAPAPALVGLPKESPSERPQREQRNSNEHREPRRSENAVPQERRDQKERHDRPLRTERTAEASGGRPVERHKEVQKAQEEKRHNPDPVKSSKSLEDLRSVLRSISSQETSKEQNKVQPKPAEKKEEKKIEEKKDDNAPVSLRDALSMVLKDTQAEAPKEPEIHKVEPVPVVNRDVVPEPEPKPPLPPIAENPAPVTSPITPPAEPSAKEDPLSPRKLERMMRVTFSDKNPLG
jgi:hypothetical protein